MTPAVTEPALAFTGRLFRSDYAAHRATEGRAHGPPELDALPYLASGPLARQWAVRARSYDALVERVLVPARARSGTLSILDLGAGCGWLCRRAVLAGDSAVALDIRDDTVDGLGAAAHFLEGDPDFFGRIVGSFDAIPVSSGIFDVAIFNGSIHYALGLASVLHEAARVVRPGGRIVIVDSPFYRNDADGTAMVAEKRREAASRFGERACTLLGPPFIEYLTPARLVAGSAGLGVAWRRHRVRYPAWYEARPAIAWLRGRRQPSRFDVWECTVP